MKTTRILTLWLGLIVLAPITTIAQDLNKMPKAKRDSCLLAITKDMLLKFGDERFYKEMTKAIIDSTTFSIKNEIPRDVYQVTYYYDSTKFTMNPLYLARVHLDKVTGKPLNLRFGTGKGYLLQLLSDTLEMDDIRKIEF